MFNSSRLNRHVDEDNNFEEPYFLVTIYSHSNSSKVENICYTIMYTAIVHVSK
jgi:hypothetical protein